MIEIIAEPNSQVVKLVAVFDIGRQYESKRGQAMSVANMMKKATLRKSNSELQELLDRYAINIEVYSSPIFITAELHCHRRFVTEAIGLFFEILFETSFPEHIWQVVRNQSKEQIIQQENQTDFWADKLMSEQVMGAQNPLGYYSEASDYDLISTTDLELFYSKFIQKSRPRLFLAGDVDSEIELFIDKTMAAYSFEENNSKPKIEFPTHSSQIMTKKLDDSSQASIRLGKLIPRASFQEFLELELYNTMLGGYYTSELMQELRIKNGFTYGVYSYLIHFPGFSFFQIGFETDEDAVDPSLKAIKDLFSRLNTDVISPLVEARKQYYSQWSKNAERSLQEIMYRIKLSKLDYEYSEYKTMVEHYTAPIPFDFSRFKAEFFNFESYSQSIVC
jgi:zinc protease